MNFREDSLNGFQAIERTQVWQTDKCPREKQYVSNPKRGGGGGGGGVGGGGEGGRHKNTKSKKLFPLFTQKEVTNFAKGGKIYFPQGWWF